MEIQRNAYLQTIRERLQTYPVVSSLGPRQAGKTTLARMLAAESAGAVHLFDLESPVDLTRLSNPELVLRSLEGLIVLDEVQRRPDLFPLLRVLAGRVSFVDVTGFSLSKLGASLLSRLWWRGGTRPATTKSMRIAQQDLSLAHLCIVHPAEQSYPLDESITATPLPELLRILHTGADQ